MASDALLMARITYDGFAPETVPNPREQACRIRRRRLPRRTSTKRAGPAARDACSARAKQASARDRSALSEVVRSGRVSGRRRHDRFAPEWEGGATPR
jgi:hypothetical protein